MSLIPASMTKSLATSMLKAKKNSPHIFFGAGLVGVIGSTVLACRATLKLEDTLDKIRKDVDDVAADRTVTHSGMMMEKSDADHAKDVGIVTFKGVVELSKLYGPAVVVGGVSVALLTGSHVQLTRRNAALTAAFTAITKAYEDYRARVRAELGAERELEIYRGLQDTEMVDEKGKKHIVKTVDPDGFSPYARRFDSKCDSWEPNFDFNQTFIQLQERYANHRLNADGFVFLNDVYTSLGMPRTSAGAVVGWLKNNPDGDNYIDFGLFLARNRGEEYGIEPDIWLDFNVDGVIYDRINEIV